MRKLGKGIGGWMLAVGVALALAMPMTMSLATDGSGEYNYYLVKFAELPNERVRGDIEAAYHVEFLGYHQDKTYMLRIPVERLAQVSACPLISSVSEYSPAEKTSPELEGAVGVVKLRIDVHPGEDVDAVASQLASLGATVTRVESNVFYYIECQVDASAIQEMADLKPVYCIHLDGEREIAPPVNSTPTPPKVSGSTKNVMVTGFWNPTGQMIAHWSLDPYLNPGGWDGANWEGWGFNVYSYFPDWHGGLFNGTFEVDYQNVGGYPAVPGFYGDFWNITNIIHPVAIIGFGAGNGPWMLENNARNLGTSPMWIDDNWNLPYQPTPRPPDSTRPQNYVRHSSLPKQNISNDVTASGIPSVINNGAYGTMGEYLCEFTAYLEEWYQAAHNYTNDSYRCYAAGWVHTDSEPLSYTYAQYRNAANITVRDTIKYLRTLVGTTADVWGPLGSSNVEAVTLTYTWTGTPTSVDLYYTKDAGATWTLAGNDATVDGSFTYTITAGDGTYGWLASAVGGGSTEPSPPTGGTTPEAASYILDNVAPAPPTAFTVRHWGSTVTNNNYNYTGVTAAAGPHNAYTYVAGTTTPPTQANMNAAATEYTDAQYTPMAASDNTRNTVARGVAGTVTQNRYEINGITEAAGTITNITIAWEGQFSVAVSAARLYVYNYTSATWVQNGATLAFVANTENTFTRYVTGVKSNWMSAGTMRYIIFANARAITYVDYTAVTIRTARDPTLDNTLNWTHAGTDVAFYDVYCSAASSGPWDGTTLVTSVPVGTNTYCHPNKGLADTTLWWYVVRARDAAGNLETNGNSVQEPGAASAAWANISVVAGWNLVSVPIAGPATMPTALLDITGGVVWTRAMWYNPTAPADPWKQYYSIWNPAFNDLTMVNSTCGVWLYVTNVSDGQICVGGAGYSTPTTTAIQLRAGWNMIGYPARVDTAYTVGQLKAATGATTVEGFSAGATYKTQELADPYIMKRGEGYWVYAPSDAVWTVDW
jgi:pyrrolidone-carboxylate peptidase